MAGRDVRCFGDLLLHLPKEYIDDSTITPIFSLREGETVRVQGRIIRKQARGFGRKRQVTLLIADESGGELTASFFHSGYMMQDARLSEGRQISLRGVVEQWRGNWQMSHPDWVVAEKFAPGLQPVYASLAGLSGKRVAGFIHEVLKRIPAGSASPLDAQLSAYPALRQALMQVHAFDGEDGDRSKGMERLKLEELLIYFQLIREKREQAELVAPALARDTLDKKMAESLPFPLTEAQQSAWRDIAADLASGVRMHRLLQGDVGAGKTWVAALAMVRVAEHGMQAALMAPTEVLAQQHYETLQTLLQPLGLEIALLTGSTRKAQRSKLTEALKAGELQLIVGTHALLTEDVVFRQLGLAIVDEQHRFGVRQRWVLTEKGEAVHLLAMTATPIPRSLALALYGDMDLSVMHGMPPGRKPVETRVLQQQSMGRLAEGMQRILDEGAESCGGRIYWIVPRIEEEEDGISVAQRAEALAKRFPDERVEALHGRMKTKEKQAALNAFASGESRILVSTTVVEVGVNVPEARLIVIEQSDRYGLAQLHQLRGRVGRSSEQGYCMLLADKESSPQSMERLQMMSKTHDGLELAEADLKMRGAGDTVGVRQSGDASFRVVDMVCDAGLIREWFEQAPAIEASEQMLLFWRPDHEVD